MSDLIKVHKINSTEEMLVNRDHIVTARMVSTGGNPAHTLLTLSNSEELRITERLDYVAKHEAASDSSG